MSENETLRQQLLYAPKNGYDRLSETDRAAMRAYCQDYMHFLDAAKTEREAVTETIRMAEGAGFTAYTPGMRLKPGTKIYWNNRHKSVRPLSSRPMASMAAAGYPCRAASSSRKLTLAKT